jgi:hypothetical protein
MEEKSFNSVFSLQAIETQGKLCSLFIASGHFGRVCGGSWNS